MTVPGLEKVAMDSLAAFFKDKDDPKYVKKQTILKELFKELFKIAKTQAGYQKDEVGKFPLGSSDAAAVLITYFT
jgi:hypothetical protein